MAYAIDGTINSDTMQRMEAISMSAVDRILAAVIVIAEIVRRWLYGKEAE